MAGLIRFVILGLIVALPVETHAAELKVGVAVAEITPPLGGPLWGYAARHDAPSKGVRDPLFAKVVLIEDGSDGCIIASLDMGRPPTRNHMAALRDELAAIRVKHCFVVATHTHHGPVVELDDWPNKKNPIGRQVTAKISELAKQARASARPARFMVGGKQVALNRNRQSKRADAAVDRELTVWRFESLDQKPIAVLVNFAAHPTMLDAKLLEFSADYPGSMAKHVEREVGAPCLFLQGASGDLSAKSPTGTSGPVEFGKVLADQALSINRELKHVENVGSIRGAREQFVFKCNLDVRDPLVKFAIGRAFFPALVDFYESEYAQGSRPETTVVTIGKTLGLVGFSGEMFCGHALSLKRRARMDHLMVFGCCNDYQQYFPTIEALAEGGYGTIPPIAMAEAGAGERMTDHALIQLFKLRGLIP